MQLNLFNGGLNLRGSPFLISQNQSVDCENIDFAKGSLYPRNKNLILDTGFKPYIYKFKGNWIQSDAPRDYVEYQDKLYYTEASKKPQKSSDGINFYNLGIDKPTGELTIVSSTKGGSIVAASVFTTTVAGLSIGKSFSIYCTTGSYTVSTGNPAPGQENIKHFYVAGDVPVEPLTGQTFKESLYLEMVYGTSEDSYNTSYKGYSKVTLDNDIMFATWLSKPSVSTKRSEYTRILTLSDKGTVSSSVAARFVEDVHAGDSGTSTTFVGQTKALMFTKDLLVENKNTSSASINLPRSGNSRSYSGVSKTTEDQKLQFSELKDRLDLLNSTINVVIVVDKDGVKTKYNSEVIFSLNAGSAIYGLKIESLNESFNLDDVDFWVFLSDKEDANPVKITKNPDGLPEGYYWVNWEYDDSVFYKDFSQLYDFCYTYYNINDGTESQPSDYQQLDVNEINTITWNTEVDDKQITHVRIYCIGKNNTNMTLLAEVPLNYGSYTFSIDAIQNMTGAVLASQLYYPAPTNLQYLTESNGILYGAEGYTLYFSNDGNANYWNPFNTITYETEIKGIARVYQGLLVFLIDKTYLVTGSSIADLTNYRLSSTVGCLDHRSIQYSNFNVIWASSDGICSCKGGTISNLSMANLGTFNITETIRFSAYHNDIYYLALPGRVFIMDMRFEVLFEWLTDNIMSYFRDPETDKLYAVDFYGNFIHIEGSKELQKVKFLSPKYSDGSISTLKSYKNIYCYTEGELTLSIYLDDNLIATQTLKSGYNDVKIPQQDTQGYFLQFLIEGQGIMHELSYIFEGRQNGR